MAGFFSRRIAAASRSVRKSAGVDRKVSFDVDEKTGEAVGASIERGPTTAATAALVGGAERAFAPISRLDISKLDVLHADGGLAAFAQETRDAEDVDLLAAYYGRRSAGRAQAGLAFGALLVAALMVAWGEFVVAACLVSMGSVFGLASYASIFRAWQIRERRMGSVREFYRAASFWPILMGEIPD